MIKEKLIFWPFLAIFIGMLIFGFLSQGKKKEATQDLLQDIEKATKKELAKKKTLKDSWDFDSIRAQDTLDAYKLLLKRSPFFRVRPPEERVKEVEVVKAKKEPKEVIFRYKGRVMLGSEVKVIIEDQGTGKSFFVKEGDMIGDFLVMRIDDEEVALKKKGGKEIVLSAVKKQKEKKQESKKDEKDIGL